MSSFGASGPSDIATAADKFISKMDESQLAEAIERHQATMQVAGRRALVASILDAFRHRGESSEDVSEAITTGVDSLENAEVLAVAKLLRYVGENAGLLKEAVTSLLEDHPEMLPYLPMTLVDGISARLAMP